MGSILVERTYAVLIFGLWEEASSAQVNAPELFFSGPMGGRAPLSPGRKPGGFLCKKNYRNFNETKIQAE